MESRSSRAAPPARVRFTVGHPVAAETHEPVPQPVTAEPELQVAVGDAVPPCSRRARAGMAAAAGAGPRAVWPPGGGTPRARRSRGPEPVQAGSPGPWRRRMAAGGSGARRGPRRGCARAAAAARTGRCPARRPPDSRPRRRACTGLPQSGQEQRGCSTNVSAHQAARGQGPATSRAAAAAAAYDVRRSSTPGPSSAQAAPACP
jgi:hypothetical protein